MQEYKYKIEAILFTTGRFMSLEEIAQICEIGSVGLVKEALEELKKDYETRRGALTLLEDSSKVKLAIKKEFNYLTTKLLAECELDKPTQETLAIIAYKQPVLQSEIVNIRGTPAYDHIKFLSENGFITREKHGRTRMIKLTSKFFDYFDIVEDHLKMKFDSAEIKDEHKESLGHADEKKEVEPEHKEQESPEVDNEETTKPGDYIEEPPEKYTEEIKENT